MVNGLLVESEGDTPIVIVNQRGAVKRMLAQELTQLVRAKRGLNGLKIIEKNPHRVAFMSEGNAQDLLITTQKGSQHSSTRNNTPSEIVPQNGSFAIDDKPKEV